MTVATRPARSPVQSKNMWKESLIRPKQRESLLGFHTNTLKNSFSDEKKTRKICLRRPNILQMETLRTSLWLFSGSKGGFNIRTMCGRIVWLRYTCDLVSLHRLLTTHGTSKDKWNKTARYIHTQTIMSCSFRPFLRPVLGSEPDPNRQTKMIWNFYPGIKSFRSQNNALEKTEEGPYIARNKPSELVQTP